MSRYSITRLSLTAASGNGSFVREAERADRSPPTHEPVPGGGKTDDIYYPPDESHRAFFRGVLGLDLPPIQGSCGIIPGEEVQEFGELLPAVAGDNPFGRSGYLEEGEIRYLKHALRMLGIGGEKGSDSKVELLKQLLRHECWGKRDAFRNLFRRFVAGSNYWEKYSSARGVVFGTDSLGRSDAGLTPNTECDYARVPEGLLIGHPVPMYAPIPLTEDLEGFECAGIGRSILRIESEKTLPIVKSMEASKEESVLKISVEIRDVPIEGSLFVIDKERGYLLSAFHAFKDVSVSSTHVTLVGISGTIKIPLSDIMVGHIEGKDVVLIKLSDPEVLGQYEDIEIAYPDLAAQEEDAIGTRYAGGYAGFFNDDGTESPSLLVVERMQQSGSSMYFGTLVKGMSGGPTINSACAAVAVSYAVSESGRLSFAEPINEELIRDLEQRFKPLNDFLKKPLKLKF